MYNWKEILDRAEILIETAIFFCLLRLAFALFEFHIFAAGFYIVLAAIICPLTNINRPAKRILLVCGFVGGVLLGLL